MGTNSTASTGTVPNEVPMPIVTSQTDERDDDGCDRPAAADGGNAGVHKGVNAAGRLDDRCVAACDEHDDGDLTHQTDAALDLARRFHSI